MRDRPVGMRSLFQYHDTEDSVSLQHVFSAVSNDTAVAKVSGSWKTLRVSGVAPGQTTITVSDKIGNSLDVPVTVQ